MGLHPHASSVARVGGLALGLLSGAAFAPSRRAWAYEPDPCAAGNVSGCVERVLAALPSREADFHLEGAVHLLQDACRAEDVDACLTVASLSVFGFGVEQSLPSAQRRFDATCLELQVPVACAQSALLSATGVGGVPRDPARAALLNRIACDAAEGMGCTGLGSAYSLGMGVPADQRRAVELFERACALGHALGCERLAALRPDPTGVQLGR